MSNKKPRMLCQINLLCLCQVKTFCHCFSTSDLMLGFWVVVITLVFARARRFQDRNRSKYYVLIGSRLLEVEGTCNLDVTVAYIAGLLFHIIIYIIKISLNSSFPVDGPPLECVWHYLCFVRPS